jgi:hypothetical protein
LISSVHPNARVRSTCGVLRIVGDGDGDDDDDVAADA